MIRAKPDASRISSTPSTEITLDEDNLALIQKGKYDKPAFFGNISSTKSYDLFKSGVSTALGYAGFAMNIAQTLVDERKPTDAEFLFTRREYEEIQRKSRSIAAYGNTPVDTIEAFLLILCAIDNIDDMEKIAVGIEIPELIDVSILRHPFEILAIQRLEKIAFMAQALDAFIRMFNRYLKSRDSSDSKPESISNLVSSLGSILGGSLSSSVRLENSSSVDALGHFMSELIDGKRIPMSVIAKNPMKASPSYVGQTLFGESPTALSLVDVTELFPKKIGVFPMPSNGAGVSSFGMQNFSSLQGNLNVFDAVNKLSFGGGSVTANSFKERAVNAVVDQVKNITGATSSETFSLNSADVSIPMMIALSAANSGLSKSPFSYQTFQQAWQMSSGVSNLMQNQNPQFLNIIRGLT
jgi:hypothetical protein